MALVYPVVAPLGVGGIFGFTTGVVFRKLGEKAAYVVGLAFLGLTGLQHLGYVKVDYIKIVDDAQKVVDANNDGKITVDDFIIIWRNIRQILTVHLPGAGGFSAGFALGLYYGK